MTFGLQRDNIDWSWSEWARLGHIDNAAVTSNGRQLLEWALDVVTEFFTDEWLRRQFILGDVPVMNLATWPLNSPSATLELIERAARISLLDAETRRLLANSIRDKNGSQEFDHLDLILETCGFAIRDGWTVEAEVESPSGRKPDLRIGRHSMHYTIEVTLIGADRDSRQMDRQHQMLSQVLFSIERKYDVELTLTISRTLSEDEQDSILDALESIASRCSRSLAATDIELEYAFACAYPIGGRPDGTVLDGPSTGNDLWERVARRLQAKADQTQSAGLSWVRIDEGSGLLALTGAYHWTIAQQLAALERNVTLALENHDHVRGVILTTGIGLDFYPQTPELGERNPLSGATAQERRLPAGRRRRSFVVPVRTERALILPNRVRIDPALWFRDEYGWIDWALSTIGKPALTPFLSGEPQRRLRFR